MLWNYEVNALRETKSNVGTCAGALYVSLPVDRPSTNRSFTKFEQTQQCTSWVYSHLGYNVVNATASSGTVIWNKSDEKRRQCRFNKI